VVAFTLRRPASFAEARPRRRGNGLSVLRAAYDLTTDEGEWIRAVTLAIAPVLDRGLGVCGHYFDFSPEGSGIAVDAPVLVGCMPGLFETYVAAARASTPDELADYFAGPPCKSLSEAAKRFDFQASRGTQLVAEATGIRDQLLVLAWDGPQCGCAFEAPVGRTLRFPARAAATLSRVARHVAAGRRLRRTLRTTADGTALDAEAVVNDRGQLLHAEGEAREPKTSNLLACAAKRLFTDRARLEQSAPDEALRLWNALVDGRWSLVDTVDSDGKRLLLVRENRMQLPEPTALTPDERYVVALFARGHSLRLVCYELGLAPATVSERLQRALKKLGIKSRMELRRLNERHSTGRRP